MEKHTFCCGGKNCPAIVKENDGKFVVSDDHADVSDGQARASISFTPEQASELKQKLEDWGY